MAWGLPLLHLSSLLAVVVGVSNSGFHLVLDTLATASYGRLGSIP